MFTIFSTFKEVVYVVMVNKIYSSMAQITLEEKFLVVMAAGSPLISL